MGQKISKAKYWTAVLYPESMVDDWESRIADLVQVSFEYCKHDKDKLDTDSDNDEDRKVHIHLILAFSNTTTFNHALQIFQKLQPSCKYCEQILNIRYMHEYLIHNTDSAKKQKKHLYDVSERICGNNFDIGSYEQLSISEKRRMLKELCDFIQHKNIYNFMDFYSLFSSNFSADYFEIIASYSGMLERLCKGNYLKMYDKK